MIEKTFNPEMLYNKVVHYYIDKKGYTKDQANSIAQSVIRREAKRRMCKNESCFHSLDYHIRNSDTCLILNCNCSKFLK